MAHKDDTAASVLFFLLVAFPLILFFPAFVEMRLWNWYAVPLFHAPVLRYGQAWALGALVTLVKGIRGSDPSKPEQSAAQLSKQAFARLFIYAIAWFGGWLFL